MNSIVNGEIQILVPAGKLITCQAVVQAATQMVLHIVSPTSGQHTLEATGTGGEFTANFEEVAQAENVYRFSLGKPGVMLVEETVLAFRSSPVAEVYSLAANDQDWHTPDSDFNDLVATVTVYYNVG